MNAKNKTFFEQASLCPSEAKCLKQTTRRNSLKDKSLTSYLMRLHFSRYILLCLCLTIGMLTTIQAQVNKPVINKKYTETPYKTYSRIQKLTFPEMINYKDTVAHLSDFKGKLVILDFWGTYCDPCFKTFPLEDSLQREYGDKLQFILTNCDGTSNVKQSVAAFLKRWAANHTRPLSMPVSIIGPEFFKLFTIMVTPTFIWIDPDGEVLGYTTAEFMTRQNVEQMLHEIAMQNEEKRIKMESNLKNIKKSN